MKKDKISIIISVYNTEKYLEKCIDSILNQTYKNIEIILIEDGSKDKSKELLLKYNKYKNVKLLFNEKNMGLAYSRNVGLENATGEYIGFIDSDDFISEDYFEKLMKSIIDNKSEIAICDFKLIYEDSTNISLCYEDEFNLLSVISNGLAASCCNKLFKKSVINKYRFETGKINEDIAVVIPALVNAKRISYVEDCYYNYYQRNTSIQNSKFSDKRFDIIEAVELTKKRIENNKNTKIIIDSLVFYQIILLLYFVIPKEKNVFRRQNILRKFHKLTKNIKMSKNETNLKYIKKSGRIHSKYYKALSVCTDNGLCFATNIIIVLYQILRKLRKTNSVIKRNIDMNTLITLSKKQSKKKSDIKISVVIPNYNYDRFMYQRLYSILNQTYGIYEIVILDDCSKDKSRITIKEIVEELKKYINIKYIFNEKNSGTAFKQWQKGLKNVSGDYVWIAEADDYCEKDLLEKLIKPIMNDDNIIISYADTSFINAEGNKIRKSIKSEIDIMKTGHWDSNYVNNGIDEVANYAFLNNTIANVSSCLIKNDNYFELLNESCDYKQSGDWIFYVNLMKKGKVAYYDKPLNYYRVHGNNVSSTMNRKKHIDEILKIYTKINKEFDIIENKKAEQKKRIEFLKDVWKVK